MFSDVNDAFFFIFDCSRSFPEFLKNFNFLHVRCGGGGLSTFLTVFSFSDVNDAFFFIFDCTTAFPVFLGFSKFFSFCICRGGCSLGTYCVYIEPVCIG